MRTLQVFRRFGSAWIPLEKCLLAESVTTHAPPAASLRRTWKACLKSPLWTVQRHESHWRWGLASTADVEDTRRTGLGLYQQLNGQYGAEHCHVVTKHLYSEVRVVWTWLQDADASLRDIHTLHCSQCSPRACSAPRLPLVHPKSESVLSFPACLTRSRRACYRTSAVHEFPSPFVHFL